MELIEGRGDGIRASGLPGREQRAFGITREGNYAFGILGDLVPRRVARTFAFAEIGGRNFGFWILDFGFGCGRARFLFGVGNELAEVLVAGATGGEKG